MSVYYQLLSYGYRDENNICFRYHYDIVCIVNCCISYLLGVEKNIINICIIESFLSLFMSIIRMTFRITREQAAQQLGISTRTIDRYIKSGKLAYKKIANKILLDEKDIQSMQHDFNALHHNPTTEIVNDGP